MTRQQDIDRLVAEITELVLARLGPAAPGVEQPPRAPVLLLAAGPSACLRPGAEPWPRLAAAGWRLEAAAPAQLAVAVSGLPLAAPARELDAAACCELLSRLDDYAALVLVGCGLARARLLAAGEDERPVERLVWQALLRGLPVLVADDGLRPGSEAAGAAARAREAARELERLGLELLPVQGLGGRLEQLGRQPETQLRQFDGLLTEAAVEQLAAAGRRRVVVPAGTLVTPLAASRAAELGLELLMPEPQTGR